MNPGDALKKLRSWRALALPNGSAGARDVPFDFDWRFHLGDVPGAQRRDHDDSGWRAVELPHDWSIEDLPPRKERARGVVIDLTRGKWRMKKGDDRRWRDPDLNESGWEEIELPRHCHPSIGPLDAKSFGWYRRGIEVPRGLKGKRMTVYLGRADDVDEAFFNGVRIGGSGKFPPSARGAHHVHRLYEVPARLVRWGGGNRVAVRVYSSRNRGGLFRGAGRGRSGPFDSESVGGPGVAHAVGGTGWYRKRFRVPAGARERRVHLEFDGIYMNSEVWLNGRRLGGNPYGYTPFWLDLTRHVVFGGENVVAVRVRNEGKNCRWYSGSGIYRSVKMTVMNPVHVAHWGVHAATVRASPACATVRCVTSVENESGRRVRAEVISRIVDREGRTVAEGRRAVSVAGGPAEVRQDLRVARPKRWSPDSPYIYRVVSELAVNGGVADAAETPLGIRTISFDARNGFRLNGKSLLLKGGCVHHDNGPLGARAYRRADERRVEIMKRSGFNAIRTSHNPPSASFLDACDRLGMLVIEEAFDQWKVGSNPEDYHAYFKKWWKRDIEAMVMRDRSRPSVIMWSIGNEIGEQDSKLGLRTARKLAGRIRELDRARAVTQGVNGRAPTWRSLDRLFGVLDVCGYNYQRDQYVPDHKLFPRRVMYASESFSIESHEFWRSVAKHPWVIGDFVWTGYDYLGEAGIGWSPDWVYMYPWTVAYCGEIDLTGHKTPASHYRDALWKKGDHLSLFVHVPKNRFDVPLEGKWSWPDVIDGWNWAGCEGKNLKVVAYTSCDRVALTLNGRSLGAREVGPESRLTAEWDVPYAPGALKAVGFRKGRKVVDRTLRTAGKPARVRLCADRAVIRADGQDLCYVDVEITDARGLRHPLAGNAVRFSIAGAGAIAAVGSAKPDSTESFQRKRRRAWNGRCQAIIRATRRAGEITLRASSSGLAGASLTIRAE